MAPTSDQLHSEDVLRHLVESGSLSLLEEGLVRAAAEAASATGQALVSKLYCDQSHWCVVVPS